MKDRTEVLQPSAKKVRFPYIDFELLREFQPYVAGSKKETLCTIALITIGVIINIILPILIRDLTQKPDINLICRTALILVLLYIYHIVACIGHVKAAAQGRVLVEKLKTTALSRIHNMSFGDAVTQPAEILASLITQGSQCVGDHLSEALTDLYQSVLFFICFTIGLIYLSPQMCAILGIVALLNKLVTTSLSTDFSQKSNDLADKNSRALKHLINVLSLQSTVRLFHVQNQTETSYRGLLGETTRIGHEVDWQLHFSSGATFCINNTLYILLVVAARYLKDAGRLNDGDLFLFFFFVKRWLDHVGEIAKIISKLRGMQGSTETLRSILRTQYNPQNELVGKAMNEIAHSEIVLRATDLHFHYGAKGMTFELKAGRLYCMIGKSGEGKTTTMRLLSSLLELTRGKLERSEAVVLCEQDAGILTGTVHDNIAIGMSGDLPATRDDVLRAAKRAAFDLVAKDLPNGYDTMLRCEGEIPLSGGQLQRLCLSRAFMSNAKIMIFDEPTKGLDNAFATHVVNSLLQLRNEGRTILVVTHDLRIAERAEWIYLVHEGKIEGEGRHTELEQKSDMYRNMLHESCTS